MSLFKGKTAGKISLSKKFADGSRVTVKLVAGPVGVTEDALVDSINKNDATASLKVDYGQGLTGQNGDIEGFLNQGKELLDGIRKANSAMQLAEM